MMWPDITQVIISIYIFISKKVVQLLHPQLPLDKEEKFIKDYYIFRYRGISFSIIIATILIRNKIYNV